METEENSYDMTIMLLTGVCLQKGMRGEDCNLGSPAFLDTLRQSWHTLIAQMGAICDHACLVDDTFSSTTRSEG